MLPLRGHNYRWSWDSVTNQWKANCKQEFKHAGTLGSFYTVTCKCDQDSLRTTLTSAWREKWLFFTLPLKGRMGFILWLNFFEFIINKYQGLHVTCKQFVSWKQLTIQWQQSYRIVKLVIAGSGRVREIDLFKIYCKKCSSKITQSSLGLSDLSKVWRKCVHVMAVKTD